MSHGRGIVKTTCRGLSAVLLCALSLPVHAADIKTAFVQAVDACLRENVNRETLATDLQGTAWIEDKEAPVKALFSVHLAIRWNPKKPGFNYENGLFMAASILGNSAMKPNQPGFKAGEANFAVLNIEDNPYCVFSGPRTLEETATERLGLNSFEDTDIRRVAEAELAGRKVKVAIIESEQARAQIAEAPVKYAPHDPIYPFNEFNLLIDARRD